MTRYGKCMLRVKKVEYLKDYKLKIVFNNGKTKIVDFESWVFEENVYLKPLRNIEYFKKVCMDDSNYSICWPNGADFCPDVLFEAGKEAKTIRAARSTRRIKKTIDSRKSRLNKKL